MKQNFKAGDRVRIYFGDIKPFDREVESVTASGILIVTPSFLYYGTTACGVRPQQCRRLKPKPEKKEPRRIYIYPAQLERVRPSASADVRVWDDSSNAATGAVTFIELLPGHVLVDREMLAKAWDEQSNHGALASPIASESGCFREICKALGLEAK